MALNSREKIKPAARGAIFFSISLVSGLAIFFMAQSGIQAVMASPRFYVNEIELHWSKKLNRPVERCRLKPGGSIFDLNLVSIEQSVQRMFPTAEVVAVRRLLPNRLVAEMTPRRVVAQLRADLYYPVSEQGVVVGEGKAAPWPHLPVLYLDEVKGRFQAGAAVPARNFDEICDLLLAVQRAGGILGHNASSVRTQKSDLVLYLDSGMEVRFNRDHLRRGWEQLTELMIQKKSMVAQAQYIDLRFEDPVISEGKEQNKKTGVRKNR